MKHVLRRRWRAGRIEIRRRRFQARALNRSPSRSRFADLESRSEATRFEGVDLDRGQSEAELKKTPSEKGRVRDASRKIGLKEGKRERRLGSPPLEANKRTCCLESEL